MSKTPIFSRLFARSPITPIQTHIATCERCALELTPFLHAVIAGDRPNIDKHYQQILVLEEEADDIKKDIRLTLPRSLFLPVSRNHLLEILQIQDRIANASKDIAGLIIGRDMKIPEPVQSLLMVYVGVSTEAVTRARETMDELNDLISTGFSEREIDFIESKLEQLHEAEHESDLRQVEVRKVLFQHEADYNPIDVMFFYKIIDLVGELADDAQTVGNRMMYLIAN